MSDSSDKAAGDAAGEGGSVEGEALGNGDGHIRVAWVKLGKIWWPGKVLGEDELTDEMKKEINQVKSKKKAKTTEKEVYVVKYFNEDDFTLVRNPQEIILSPDNEKKMDLVKRAILQMKSSSLAENLPKFKADVLDAERLLDPSADLTTITCLLDGDTSEPKKPTGVSKYADIFPSAKPEKPVVSSSLLGTPTGRGGRQSAKFNFPSSRIISSASSKPLSKISPLPCDPSKKYRCQFCGYSTDRLNNLPNHIKFCSQKNSASPVAKSPVTVINQSPVSSSTASPQKPTTAVGTATTPADKKLEPQDGALSATTSTSTPTVKRPAGRASRGSKATAAKTPLAPSPLVKASPVKTVTSPVKTPAKGAPKRRGRRSTKKDKLLGDKQKAEILQDWNDSSSEGDGDTDDELDMPPSKPPELFLFGSEKNKKRKVEPSPILAGLEDEGVKTVEEEGKGAAATGTVSDKEAQKLAPDEDQPPVLKKPRTDKELSDAFEALLKNTKPEYEKLLEKDLSNKEQSMEVEEEDNHQMSDIEEDALIVMKKVDEQDKVKEVKELASVVEGDTKDLEDAEKGPETLETNTTPDETKKDTTVTASEESSKEPPPKRESRRTRNSRAAAVADEVEKSVAEWSSEPPKKKEKVETAVLPQLQGSKKEESDGNQSDLIGTDASASKGHVEKDVSQGKLEVSEAGVAKGRTRRGRLSSRIEESADSVVDKKVVAPTQETPTVKGKRGRAKSQLEAKPPAETDSTPKTDEVKVEAKTVKTPTVHAVTPTLASTRSRRGVKTPAVIADDVKETPKRGGVKETSKVSKNAAAKPDTTEGKEEPKKAEAKETSKKSGGEETSKKVETKETPKKTEEKETPKRVSTRESSKKTNANEASKKVESKETDGKEVPKNVETKETSKKLDKKETPKKEETKEVSNRTDVKEESKKVEAGETSKKTEGNDLSKKIEIRESSKKADAKETLKKVETRETSKRIEGRNASKKPDEKEATKETEDKASINKVEESQPSKNAHTKKLETKDTVSSNKAKEGPTNAEAKEVFEKDKETTTKVETTPESNKVEEKEAAKKKDGKELTKKDGTTTVTSKKVEAKPPAQQKGSRSPKKTEKMTELSQATPPVEKAKEESCAIVPVAAASVVGEKASSKSEITAAAVSQVTTDAKTVPACTSPASVEGTAKPLETVNVPTTVVNQSPKTTKPKPVISSPAEIKQIPSQIATKEPTGAGSSTATPSTLPDTAVVVPTSPAKVASPADTGILVASPVKPISSVAKTTSPIKPVVQPKITPQSTPPKQIPSPTKKKASSGPKAIQQKATLPPPAPVVSGKQKTELVSPTTAVAEKASPSPTVPTPTAPPPPVRTPTAPQKKPTAAVRPLVDTKEISVAASMKDSTSRITVPPSSATKSEVNSVPSLSKEASAQSQQVAVSHQPSQQSQQQTISADGMDEDADGKKSPALVAQRVVHLVPVENADGSITYMLLSLENGADNPAVLLEQGADQAGSVLRLDKVEPVDTSSGGGTPNLPMNPNEVEGIFLDKSVDNANQIVSALAAAAVTTTGTVTASTSLMDATTTAYVTLAMDAASAMGGLTASAGVSDPSTAATIAHQQAQSTIITIPADASATAATSAEEQQEAIVDPNAAMGGQQVFYMTEDGALLDPQSLGLTLEQLQQLLNQ